jgi:O-antigen ligase
MRISRRRAKEWGRRLLRDGPRWLFLATLIYAPWAYGCTTSDTIAVLNWLLAAVLLFWIISCVATRRPPIIPRLLLVLVIALLLLGWWMVFNSQWVYDSDFFVFVRLNAIASALPGSIDRLISAAWMARAAMLLGVACFIADLSTRREWLMRIWMAVGVAGGSIALLGLLQKASHAQMIFWQPAFVAEKEVNPFFATYFYHGNAGAFLNLVLPPAIGLAIRAFTKPEPPLLRSLWLAIALLVCVSVLSNTSRMAQLLGITILVVIALGPLRQAIRGISRTERTVATAGALLLALTALAVAQASRLDQPWQRWQEMPQQLIGNSRWLVAQAAWRGIDDAGWFGFGPGTFRSAFPYLTGYLGDRVYGVWRFLHEDYLQTLLEWGRVGAALWGGLLFGGIFVAVRNSRSPLAKSWSPRRRSLLPLIYLPLIATALHAAVDFPLQIASIQLYVATYLGLCWGSSNWQKSETLKS